MRANCDKTGQILQLLMERKPGGEVATSATNKPFAQRGEWRIAADKAKAGLLESGLHKEGRRRFGGILSLFLRYALTRGPGIR
jgi:hypothetical protein